MRNSLIDPPPAPCVLGKSALLAELRGLDRGQIAYLFDFDGTLVDLSDRPDSIVVPPGLTETLLALSNAAGGALAIITGRERDFVLDRLGTDRLEVVGLHGAEEAGQPLAALPESALAPARAYARMTPGIIAEDKGGAFALHFRLAPDRAAQVHALMAVVAQRAGCGFRLKAGKSVWELCPAKADKGAALARLMQRAPFAGRRPLAIGDDLTDEPMFVTANQHGGFAVFVDPHFDPGFDPGPDLGPDCGPDCGPELCARPAPRATAGRVSAAGYRLGAPAEVRTLLKELAP